MEMHNNLIGTEINNTSIQLNTLDEKFIQINRELEDAAQGLQDLNKQKDAFISIAAHELKTPITSIQGFAQLLQDEKLLSDVEQSKHYIDLITNNTDRLYGLILNIIDAFKIINKAIVLNISDTNVYELRNNLETYTITNSKNKDIQIDFCIQENLPLIHTDSEKITRVIKNLISNSIKFTESGLISIKIHREGDYIKFEVKDTGQGISKDNQKYIFTNFYQVNTSLSRKNGGVGLGLFICKGLVENMGGKIWFDSELGKGSTFYILIPIAHNSNNVDKAYLKSERENIVHVRGD